MPDYYLDEGLASLRAQLQMEHPGVVVGWIGDASHQGGTSDHNPELPGPAPGADAGEVDAIDPMIGPHYTRAEAQADVDAIVSSRDSRMAFLIWDRRIISSTIEPWVWRTYAHNDKDPHTGHWHLSVNDRYDSHPGRWMTAAEKENRVATDITPSDANANAILNRNVVPKDGGTAGEKTTAVEALRQAQVVKNRITELLITGAPVDTDRGDLWPAPNTLYHFMAFTSRDASLASINSIDIKAALIRVEASLARIEAKLG